ncbi:MAG: class I SAM-dependent methyltransferase [Erysipelotrichaceae bacterium]
MNEVNNTLFIPLYGKATVSKMGIILNDTDAIEIWNKHGFKMKGKSKSRWLAYNMAMRARIFDDWAKEQIKNNSDSLILHLGCGLDSRYKRINNPDIKWLDIDMEEVIKTRKNFFSENENYRMISLDLRETEKIKSLPDSANVIVLMEGVSMYLKNEELIKLLKILNEKYYHVHILLDTYTLFAAKASRYKNPVNDVGVREFYGVDDINELIKNIDYVLKKEYSLTPEYLINELQGFDKVFFNLMFNNSLYTKFYRLYELENKNILDEQHI